VSTVASFLAALVICVLFAAAPAQCELAGLFVRLLPKADSDD